jgi:glycosyltransferase involved in cell wall biosynthesis
MSGPSSSPAPLPSLDVVLPCRNEQDALPTFIPELLAALAPAANTLTVIIVNDGSTDRTGAIADHLAAADPRVRVVHNPSPQGYGGALRAGFAASSARWVFITDGDGQFDPAQLPPLLPMLAGADGLVGRRRRRAEGPLRAFNGAAWTALVDIVLGMSFRDVDCAFKLLPGPALRSLPLRSRGALISAEILARLTRRGVRLVQVPVDHRPRRAGRPTGASPRVIARAFAELARLSLAIRSDR